MKKEAPVLWLRRRFFFSSVGAFFGALVALPPIGRTRAHTPMDTDQSLKSWLNGIVNDQRSAGRIGELYIAGNPLESDVELLASEVTDGGAVANRIALRRRFAALRERDFTNEDIVIVEGWVLARVEARICALIHLL